MRSWFITILLVFATASSAAPKKRPDWIEPMDAIRAANDDPQHGVRGHFVLTIKAIGADEEWTYLNSERDYRDQRCLTIRVPNAILPRLERRLGVPLKQLKGRRIVVLGEARRARIDFMSDDRPTGKYYFQTHVLADNPTQFEFADAAEAMRDAP